MELKKIRNAFHLTSNILNFINLKLNHVKFKNFVSSGIFYIYNQGHVELGNNLRINSSKFNNIIGGDTRTSFIVKKNAFLYIGDNVKISNSAIYCSNQIIIGNNVMIGGSCKIWDTDFHSLDPEIRLNYSNTYYNTLPIVIGDNVFIGGFSIILKGVIIGKNSIIGAGSIVTKNIPEGEIWAGNPAKFIKKL